MRKQPEFKCPITWDYLGSIYDAVQVNPGQHGFVDDHECKKGAGHLGKCRCRCGARRA